MPPRAPAPLEGKSDYGRTYLENTSDALVANTRDREFEVNQVE